MHLDSLRTLLAAIDQGSVAGAARSLDASRSTVRQRLDALQTQVGVELLERGEGGALRPTPAGLTLASRARGLLAQLDDALASARSAHSPTSRRTLRVAAPVGMPPAIAITFSGQLAALAPDICLEVTHHRAPLSARGDKDIVITLETAAPHCGWDAVRLVTLEENLVASAAYLERHPPVRSVDDLQQHRLLCWLPPDADPRLLPLRTGGDVSVQPHGVSDSLFLLREQALAGLGIAFVPDTARLEGPAPSVEHRFVLQDVIGRQRAVYILTASPSTRPAAIDEFIEAVRHIAVTLGAGASE